ncbi:alpha/beta hydrolase [Spirillospora sp. NPDC047279]|uniref:alpha/beta hydrolase n=1 Tax=Spirillospora sp. NPDC047279 TaxID=3155478 RepID=UPI0034025288
MPLDRNAAQLLQFLSATFPDLGGAVTDAQEARAVLAGFGFPRGPEVAAIEYRQIPGDPPIPVRIYWPRCDVSPPYPIVVYFHGGGFVLCDLDSHDGVCRSLANEAAVIVVSVDFRLAPEHKYPAAVDDAYAATVWAAAEAASLGGDPARVAVAGDSSGGTLAAVTCLRARDEQGPDLAWQLLLYPAIDWHADDLPSRKENAEGYFMTMKHMEWYAEQYLDDLSQAREPYAAPGRADNLAGLPPGLVMTAEYCPLRDEGEAYAARLAADGVAATCHRVRGLFHGFFGLGPYIPAARDAEKLAGTRLRAALNPR